MTRQAEGARYVLQIEGEQDEYGLAENVYRFQACITGRTGQVDLGTIQGFLIDHEGTDDVCVTVGCMSDAKVRCKPVQVHQGAVATRMIRDGVDVRVQVRSRAVMFLNDPTILDIGSDNEPGTRILAALRRHFGRLPIEVVVDLGTEEGDDAFNSLFFPDTHLLDLNSRSTRLLHGHWGQAPSRSNPEYTLGVIYED